MPNGTIKKLVGECRFLTKNNVGMILANIYLFFLGIVLVEEKEESLMCSISCMESSSDKCRCECGGIKHGVKAAVKKRLKFVKKKMSANMYFVGNHPAVMGLIFHSKDDEISFYIKEERVYLKAPKLGKGWPLTYFGILHGIPF